MCMCWAERLAMTHRIIEVLAICDAEPGGSCRVRVSRLDLPQKRYLVRARRIKDATPGADAVEHEVGRVLFQKGYKADLKDPEMVLRAIITTGKIVLGLEAAVMDRSSFEGRRPHLKPFFHPGVLMPRMARSLVNLTQARAGERLLDPFAGTCGILIEACLIGIEGVGIEVQTRLVKGALCNLHNQDCSLSIGRCKASAPARCFHGRSRPGYALWKVGQDPGQSPKNYLLEESLGELFRVIKPGRRMVIVADGSLDDMLANAGFEIIQKHTDRVHRSLTRHIFLCRR